MPRSRSRDRRSRSHSRDRRRDKRRNSREKYDKKDRIESSSKSQRSRDKSSERRKHRDRSKEYRRRDRSRSKDKYNDSRDNKRASSSSRSKKHRHSSSSERHQKKQNSHREETPSQSGPQMELDSIQMPDDNSTPTNAFDPRRTFEIANEFSREGFEQFSRDHGIDFTNIDTEEDRVVVHEKMEELLKAHFAAQGKIYPPPKPEKPAINAATGFANDGSFLEQFKKMQDEYKQHQEAEKKRISAEERLKNLPLRRRGGKILKTGVVAKTKTSEDGSEVPADPWSLYLKEVQKYKNASCDSDSKTRPLVK